MEDKYKINTLLEMAALGRKKIKNIDALVKSQKLYFSVIPAKAHWRQANEYYYADVLTMMNMI